MISKAYIVHYTPLVDRKKNIIEQLCREDIEPFFIEEYDRDILTIKDTFKFDKIKPSDISLILKHVLCWKHISLGDDKYGLILEDDAILDTDFKVKLNKYINERPFELLMINEGCNLHIPNYLIIEGQNLYYRGINPTKWGGNGGTRCTDGYVITKKCASDFITLFERFGQGIITKKIDHFMNDMMRYLNTGPVYWAEPSIVKQGSETGLFKKSY